jgi:hypothetical protein
MEQGSAMMMDRVGIFFSARHGESAATAQHNTETLALSD